MSGKTDEKLVNMANQIARNLALDDNPVAAVAEHIRAFWSPRMVDALASMASAALDPVAAQALALLAARVETAGD